MTLIHWTLQPAQFAATTLILLLSCGCAVQGAHLNDPFHQVQPAPEPPPIPPPPVTHRIPDIGAWLDSSSATKDFTTFVTVYLDCDASEPPYIPDDGRKILWFAGGLLTYGPTPRSHGGYALRADVADCWAAERATISAHSVRTRGIHLADEPESVAYGDRAGNDVYDPNLYNDALTTIAAMVHADFPTAVVSLNYGSTPAGLKLPLGIDRVALEAYSVDWLAKLRALEHITDKPVWLMPPAFVDGDPTVADPILAQRVKDQYAYAQTDPRVTGLYVFAFCCDDQVTGDKSFFTVGGGHLPLTFKALQDVGRAIIGP